MEAALPAEAPAPPQQPWVTLRGWHVLAQPTPRLLVCDRGRGRGKALTAAKGLVEALNATATILGVSPRRRRIEKLRSSLEERRREMNLPADVQIREGDAKEQILLEEADLRYDFLLLGEPRRRLRSRRFRSTAEVLLQSGVTPFIVVKGDGSAFGRILISTAGGEQSQGDIRVGGWIARRLGAPVTILFVHAGEGEPANWARAHLDRGVATLRGLEVESTVRVRRAGSPLEGILAEIAEGQHDLVVIGGSGERARGFFGGGSDISRQILKRSTISTLVVPEGAW
jgi:nucleotide-binding universal stress UspA family protein